MSFFVCLFNSPPTLHIITNFINKNCGIVKIYLISEQSIFLHETIQAIFK